MFKTMRFLFHFLILLISFLTLDLTPSYALPDSKINHNTVSMPWDTFQKLWKEAQDETITRDKSFAYGKIRYIGEVLPFENDDFYLLQFKADFDIEIFGNQKKLVPFLSKEIDFETIELDGKPITWTEKDDYLHVILEGNGIKKLSTTFSIKINKKKWPREIDLPLIPHANSEIILRVPEKDIDAYFEPGVSLATINIEEGSQIRGYIPSQSKVSISWTQKNSPLSHNRHSLQTSINTFINTLEETTQGTSLVNFNLTQGQTDLFEIVIPENIEIIEIKPINHENRIAQWFTETVNKKRVLKIISRYKQKKRFGIKIVFEKKYLIKNDHEFEFEAPIFETYSKNKIEQYLSISTSDQLEITEKKIIKADPLSFENINDEMKSLAGKDTLYVYEVNTSSKLNFKITPHKELSLTKTRIESVDAISILNKNGSWVSYVHYIIKNNESQYLRLKTPLKTRIQNTYLQSKQIDPALNSKGELLIPLIKSNKKESSVIVIYEGRPESIKLWGNSGLSLPKPDISINNLNWDIYIPENLQLVHQLDNNDLTQIKNDPWWKFSNSPFMSLAIAQENSSSLKSIFNQSSQNSFDHDLNINHDFKEDLFKKGTHYSIKRYLVDKNGLSFNFFYVHKSIPLILNYLIGIPLLGILFWILAMILERDYLSIKLSYVYKLIICLCLFLPLLTAVIYFNMGLEKNMILWANIGLTLFLIWKYNLTKNRIEEQTQTRIKIVPQIIFLISLIAIFTLLFFNSSLVIGIVSLLSIILLIISEKIIIKKLKNEFLYEPDSKTSSFLSISFLLLSLGFCNLSFSQSLDIDVKEIPEIDLKKSADGNVFLNWEIVKKLLEKIEHKRNLKKNEIGIDYSFGSPTINGDINKVFAELQIRIPIKLLRSNFIKIPLLPHNIAITDAKLNGKFLSLNREKDFTYLEIEKKSDELLNLELSIILPIKDRGGVPEFILDSPLIKGAKVELAHSREIESIYINEINWQEIQGNTLKASMGNKTKLNVELVLPESNKTIVKNNNIQKTYAQTYTLGSVKEKKIIFYSLIRFSILNQELDQFQFSLPSTINVKAIKAEEMKDWKAIKDDDDQTIYTINTKTPRNQSIDIHINFEQNLNDTSDQFSIPQLKVLNIARNTGYLGLESISKVSLKILNIEKSKLIESTDIPDIIKTESSYPIVYGFRYLDPNYSIELQKNIHKSYPLQSGIISKGIFNQVISPQGKIMVHAILNVQNKNKQFLAISLPENYKMLNAFLNNQSITPSINEKDQILIPLKKNNQNKDLVEFIYEGELRSLSKWAGFTNLHFPLINMPIQSIENNTYIPNNFKLVILSSKFKISNKNKAEISLSNRQVNSISNLDDLMEASNKNHSRIEIPINNLLHSSRQHYVQANQMIQFDFFYYNHLINYGLWIFFSIIVLITGYISYNFFKMKLWKKFFLIIFCTIIFKVYPTYLITLVLFLLGLCLKGLQIWLKNRKKDNEDTLSFNF